MRLNVVGATGYNSVGANLAKTDFEPRKRRDIDRKWLTLNDHLFYWKESDGDRVWFYWVEENGGAFNKDQKNFEVKYKGIEANVSIPVFLREKHSVIGSFPVERHECGNNEKYGNYTLYFELSS